MHVHRVKERQIRNIIATEKSRTFAQFHPIIVLSFTQVSLLRRLHCPILENEWKNGERIFFPFLVFILLTVSVTVRIGIACGGGRLYPGCWLHD